LAQTVSLPPGRVAAAGTPPPRLWSPAMAGVVVAAYGLPPEAVLDAVKLEPTEHGDHEDSGDETTPTTTVSECSEGARDEDWDLEAPGCDDVSGTAQQEQADDVPQLGPGLFESDAPPDAVSVPALDAQPGAAAVADVSATAAQKSIGAGFTPEETLFIFDWDDTILPSSWIQRQGLRLDAGSVVLEWQQERLAEVAAAAAKTLTAAKDQGTVVLVTNAERGWIELSCQKFLPSLLPFIENVKIVSARTAYETPLRTSPLDWKVHAFAAEIARACGAEALQDPKKRKNIHSLGDSVHEREALIRATIKLPNCCSKSLKFVDRPDIDQLLKQHSLIMNCFGQIVQHDENLDLCIDCS